MAVWSEVSLHEVGDARRCDAEYFQPEYIQAEANVTNGKAELLGGLALSIARGTQPQYTEGGDYPVLRSVNVQRGYLNDTRQEYVSAEFFEDNTRGQVEHGDVLMTSTGVGTLGRVTYNHSTDAHFADGHIAILRNWVGVDPQFVALFLQSPTGISLIERRYRGSSGQIEIYPDDISSIPIPRFGPQVEKEIADFCRQSQQKRRDSQQLYAQAEATLLEALGLDAPAVSDEIGFEAMFSQVMQAQRFDALYFHPTYRNIHEALKKMGAERIVPLGEILLDITNGQTPLHHDLSVGEVPFLTAEHILDFRVDYASEKRVELEHHLNQLKRTQLKENDLLITIKGRIGNAAIVENLPGPVNINQDVAVLRPHSDIPPFYLAGFLNCAFGKGLMQQVCTGQINPFLGLGNLKTVPIPIFTQAKTDAQNLLEDAKARVESLIAEGG